MGAKGKGMRRKMLLLVWSSSIVRGIDVEAILVSPILELPYIYCLGCSVVFQYSCAFGRGSERGLWLKKLPSTPFAGSILVLSASRTRVRDCRCT